MTRTLITSCLSALCLALLAIASPAAELSDRLMAPGLFAAGVVNEGATTDAPPVEILRYSHKRLLPGQPAGTPPEGGGTKLPGAVVDGHVSLLQDPASGTLSLQLDDGGHGADGGRIVAEFPATAPNPVLMFFLENQVRVVAAQTGGSPFYIRNRLREALANAPDGPVSGGQARVVLQPFRDDAQAARMGDFAGLSLTLVYDPDRPGRILELLADTGPRPGAYTERLELAGGP